MHLRCRAYQLQPSAEPCYQCFIAVVAFEATSCQISPLVFNRRSRSPWRRYVQTYEGQLKPL